MQAATVEQLIKELQKENPKALVLWGQRGSPTAQIVERGMRRVQVTPISEHSYSTLGPNRKIPAVLIDTAE